MDNSQSLIREIRNMTHMTVAQTLYEQSVMPGVYSCRMGVSPDDPYKILNFCATADEVAIVYQDYHSGINADGKEGDYGEWYVDSEEEPSVLLVRKIACDIADVVGRETGKEPRVWVLFLTDRQVANYDEAFYECDQMCITLIDGMLPLPFPVNGDPNLPGCELVKIYQASMQEIGERLRDINELTLIYYEMETRLWLKSPRIKNEDQ